MHAQIDGDMWVDMCSMDFLLQDSEVGPYMTHYKYSLGASDPILCIFLCICLAIPLITLLFIKMAETPISHWLQVNQVANKEHHQSKDQVQMYILF